jgi:uncharacterized membrane protein
MNKDYYLIAGLIVTIWYNWETLKQLKGIRNKLNRINYIIGILTLLFGGLLLLVSFAMIKMSMTEDNRAQLTLAALYIIMAITTIFVTIRTLNIYKTNRS